MTKNRGKNSNMGFIFTISLYLQSYACNIPPTSCGCPTISNAHLERGSTLFRHPTAKGKPKKKSCQKIMYENQTLAKLERDITSSLSRFITRTSKRSDTKQIKHTLPSRITSPKTKFTQHHFYAGGTASETERNPKPT